MLKHLVDDNFKHNANSIYPWNESHENMVAEDMLIEQCLVSSGVDRCGTLSRRLDSFYNAVGEFDDYEDDR